MSKYLGELAIPNLKAKVDAKQDTLVPGESIMTINGESILGPGDMELAKLDEVLKYVDSSVNEYFGPLNQILEHMIWGDGTESSLAVLVNGEGVD